MDISRQARLFLAVPLPAEVKDALAGLQAKIRAQGVAGTWPRADGLHLTLVFLGNSDAGCVSERLAMIEGAVRGSRPVPLKTTGLGGFPTHASARVLWVGLEPQPALAELVQALRGSLERCGVAFDPKPFKAHLTLARFKQAQDVARFSCHPAPLTFDAEAVVLYESRTTAEGTRYVERGRVRLGSV